MNEYINELKQRLEFNVEQSKESAIKKKNIARKINDYLSKKDFNYYSFIGDLNLTSEIISNISNENLKNKFVSLLRELRMLPLTDIVTNYNNEEIRRKKNEFLNTLNKIVAELLRVKYYKNPETFIFKIDKIGKDVVIIDESLEKFLYRMGMSKEEVLSLCSYTSKCNMTIYKQKMEKQKEEEIRLEEEQ